ncbi:hypothetical protein CY35_19G078700 [Sphagnum magellanicum]|nr:hypothetical protein CY35_19G078700 [Sphagnum magellanicum]
MYRERRFVSGFAKTDGRTGGRADDGRSRVLTGRKAGRTGRTGGRRTDARTRGGRAEDSGGGPETDRASERKREKTETERREGRERERERSVAAQEISWRIAHTSHQSHSQLKKRGKRPGESQKILARNGISWQ